VQRSVDRGCAGLAIELRESGDIIHILIISCPRGGVAMFQFEPPLKKIGLTENPHQEAVGPSMNKAHDPAASPTVWPIFQLLFDQ